jgi:hypothetical protein
VMDMTKRGFVIVLNVGIFVLLLILVMEGGSRHETLAPAHRA